LSQSAEAVTSAGAAGEAWTVRKETQPIRKASTVREPYNLKCFTDIQKWGKE
jgi:hypothetical protein